MSNEKLKCLINDLFEYVLAQEIYWRRPYGIHMGEILAETVCEYREELKEALRGRNRQDCHQA